MNVGQGNEATRGAVRRYFERLLNDRDLSVCDEMLAAGYIDHDAPIGTPAGPEPVKGFVSGFLAAYPDMRITIDDTIVEGRSVALRAVWRGTHGESGEAYHRMGIVMLRLDDEGRFVERWSAYAPIERIDSDR